MPTANGPITLKGKILHQAQLDALVPLLNRRPPILGSALEEAAIKALDEAGHPLESTRVTIAMPEEALKKIMADPAAFIKAMQENGIPVISIAPTDPSSHG